MTAIIAWKETDGKAFITADSVGQRGSEVTVSDKVDSFVCLQTGVKVAFATCGESNSIEVSSALTITDLFRALRKDKLIGALIMLDDEIFTYWPLDGDGDKSIRPLTAQLRTPTSCGVTMMQAFGSYQDEVTHLVKTDGIHPFDAVTRVNYLWNVYHQPRVMMSSMSEEDFQMQERSHTLDLIHVPT